ncbi:MAG: OmpW family outer membrane protein [Pseudomonadota bacterium]
MRAGIDVPVGDDGFGVTHDAKRYFIGTTAQWFVSDPLVTETEQNLAPWVLSAGVRCGF